MAFSKAEQIKELGALTVLGLLSSFSNNLLLGDPTSHSILKQANTVFGAYLTITGFLHWPLNTLFIIMAPTLWLATLFSNYKIPRIALDCVGGWLAIRMVITLVFIDALLLVPAAKPSLLLGQILAYLPWFLMVWGWLFWRIDCCGRPFSQQIIKISEATPPITSFDYYEASLYSVINKGLSGFRGKTRAGSMVKITHDLMLINIWGLVLARAYGVVQKML